MKKTMKILMVVLLAIMVLSIAVPSFASSMGVSIDDNSAEAATFKNLGSKVLGYIKVVGSFVAVGTIMILGIKYMMGSVEEKADYKKTMIPLVIGIVLLIGALWIADAVINAAGALAPTALIMNTLQLM